MVPLQSTSRTAERHASPWNLASDWTGPDYRKFTSGGQAAVGSVSAPREYVLFVSSRNVLLTRSGWGSGRSRSSHHDPGRAGPVGGPEEGAKEADYAAARSRRVGVERTPGATDVGAAEGGRGSCRGARAKTAAVEPA